MNLLKVDQQISSPMGKSHDCSGLLKPGESGFDVPAEVEKKYLIYRPIQLGALSALFLLAIYFGILSISNSLAHAWNQFVFLWYWMSTLIIGFGIQAGVFFYLKGIKKLAGMGLAGTGAGAVATTAGISTGSMVVCCLHHVVDVLPILGLSAAAGLLGQFQEFFLTLGVVSNVIGIIFMLHTIQKHRLFVEGGRLSSLMRWDMKRILIITIGLGSIGLIISFYSQI